MKKTKISERIKYWSQIFLVPLYGLSYLMPRNKKLWLFGSTFGRRFSENPRYLFLYVAQNLQDIRPVWITHNKSVVSFLNSQGYETYYYHSLKGIWLALRAGVYIYDNYSKDINFWQSGRALKINLWHGSGNKLTNHDNMYDKVRHPRNAWEKWKTWLRRLSDEKPYHYTLATSDAMAQIYTSAFKTDLQHILVCGNTRNDIFYINPAARVENKATNSMTPPGFANIYNTDEIQIREEIIAARKDGKTIITYLPTFRESESKFFEVMDLEKFDSFLGEKNCVLVAKLHPKSRIRAAFESVNGNNIINANSELDLYSFFDLCDMLITDYSSAYTDFMHTMKPSIAFDFDWEEYISESRGCYIDQDEYMPELKATTMDELMEMISRALVCDERKEARLKSRERMFKYIEGCSCKRMAGMIRELARI